MALAFQSGVTTSPIITDISGRGLGLAIVREKVERLGGSIVVKSKPGDGTAFHIVPSVERWQISAESLFMPASSFLSFPRRVSSGWSGSL